MTTCYDDLDFVSIVADMAALGIKVEPSEVNPHLTKIHSRELIVNYYTGKTPEVYVSTIGRVKPYVFSLQMLAIMNYIEVKWGDIDV